MAHIPVLKKGGFTLIEVLIVIAIIGLLSTITVVYVKSARYESKEKKVLHDISQICKAIEVLANDTNRWPGGQPARAVNAANGNEICPDGCAEGITSSSTGIIDTDGTFFGWSGPYMDSIPDDPWGRQYFFDTDYLVRPDDKPCAGAGGCVNAAVLGSYGPNGKGNNSYDSDDIIMVLIKN